MTPGYSKQRNPRVRLGPQLAAVARSNTDMQRPASAARRTLPSPGSRRPCGELRLPPGSPGTPGITTEGGSLPSHLLLAQQHPGFAHPCPFDQALPTRAAGTAFGAGLAFSARERCLLCARGADFNIIWSFSTNTGFEFQIWPE